MYFLDLNGQRSTFNVTPVNTCFVLGGEETDVQFNCTVNYGSPLDTGSVWRIDDPNGSFTQLTQNNYSSNADKYTVEGEYHLVVMNVDTSDAVFYDCTNSQQGAGSIRATAYLIILGKILCLT